MNEQVRAADIEMEIPISAAKPEVWDALIHDISLWWPKQAFMTKAKGFTLEPRVGGRVFEDNGDGTGGLWWNVHAIQTGEFLVLTGQIWPRNGGPATSIVKLSLEERGEETILKIHDSMFGRLTDERVVDREMGLGSLVRQKLQAVRGKQTSTAALGLPANTVSRSVGETSAPFTYRAV